MDNKIFCLETEWEQSVSDMKFEPQAKPMLEFLNNSNGIEFAFRQVAAKSEFAYYIRHLKRASYKDYTIVYLCFHGEKCRIVFADSGKYGGERHYDLIEFAEANNNVFDGKIVHFGSCSTLKMNEQKIKEFKILTGASMVTGYEKPVEMTESFIFEAWLLNTFYKHPDFRAKRMIDLARKEMPYFVERYIFVAY